MTVQAVGDEKVNQLTHVRSNKEKATESQVSEAYGREVLRARKSSDEEQPEISNARRKKLEGASTGLTRAGEQGIIGRMVGEHGKI